ncbi:TRAF-type zinc finger-like protein isoform X2 [Wolffia australiana]
MHCARNLEKCSICGDMIQKKLAREHYHGNHAPVDCVHCGETVERENLALHRGQICPQRIIACDYCEFQLPAVDLYEHQDLCGNRTEYCDECCRYIRLCQWADHELRSHGASDDDSEASRLDEPQAREEGASHPNRLMLTAVVTGAAILLISFFLHRRTGG